MYHYIIYKIIQTMIIDNTIPGEIRTSEFVQLFLLCRNNVRRKTTPASLSPSVCMSFLFSLPWYPGWGFPSGYHGPQGCPQVLVVQNGQQDAEVGLYIINESHHWRFENKLGRCLSLRNISENFCTLQKKCLISTSFKEP